MRLRWLLQLHLILVLFQWLLCAWSASATLFDVGNKLYGEGDLIEAEEAYRAHLSTHPEDVDCLTNLASLLVDSLRGSEAEMLYRRALNHFPTHSAALFNLASLLQETGRLEEAALLYEKVVEMEPNGLDALSNLAACFHQLNRIPEAVSLYKKAISVASFEEQSNRALLSTLYEHLGRSLLRLEASSGGTSGDYLHAEILAAFTSALEFDPSNQVAKHLLFSQQGEGGESTPPDAFVEKLFDDYALSFETSLAALEYQAPSLIYHHLLSLKGNTSSSPSASASIFKGSVLDLGCGSGLVGALIRNGSSDASLVGIDLSFRMLEQALSKGIYDRLFVGDMLEFVRLAGEQRKRHRDGGIEEEEVVVMGDGEGVRLGRKLIGDPILSVDALRQRGFDWGFLLSSASLLVIAADVLVYVGDLDPLLSALESLMLPGEVFAFTVEALADGSTPENTTLEGDVDGNGRRKDWLLQRSGRFAHSRQYLRRTAMAHSFDVVEVEKVVLRQELGQPIRGYLTILARSNGS